MTTHKEALKLALEALELCNGSATVEGVVIYTDLEIAAIKEALAQPEQEPVAWTLLLVGEHHGIIGKAGKTFEGHPEHYKRVDVYTTPPQRTWVGLTDEEELKLAQDSIGKSRHWLVAQVEAKLKEKNT